MELSEMIKYEKMWNAKAYRTASPGVRWFPHFVDRVPFEEGDLAIDFGCGTGRASLLLRSLGLLVIALDIAHNSLDDAVKSQLNDDFVFIQANLWELSDDIPVADWIYCVDVLEHIPSNKVDSAMNHLAMRTRKGGMINIACLDDPFGPQIINDTLHLTIEEPQWWLDKLNKLWDVKDVTTHPDNVYVTIIVGQAKRSLLKNTQEVE